MKDPKAVTFTILVYLATLQVTNATSVLKPVVLPRGGGEVVGAAFSPDSGRLALIRRTATLGMSGQSLIIQVVDLKSSQVLAHAGVLKVEPAELASSAHYISYSSDGRHLVLATNGSDLLTILDSADLHTERQFALHPEADSRRSLDGGRRYFRGVVSLAVAPKADTFGVVTHDALHDNEVFVGSIAPGQFNRRWSLGRGRTATQLGQISLSLSGDGLQVAVSTLPDGNRLPRNFNNLRLFSATSGYPQKSIRTEGLIGPILLLPGENLIASRIDTPGLLSKKACIEEWSFNTGALGKRFCDPGRNASVVLGASLPANRVVGVASYMRKSIEGEVYAVSGRVDVWDLRSGDLIASSFEIPRLISFLQVSRNGEWIMAGQTLFHLGAVGTADR